MGQNNTGHRNTGDCNSGNYNAGHYNSGHRNSGNRNSGHRNSGNRNSGHFNSGHGNSGDRNSGHRNSGYFNSGDYNSGDYNSGSYNSGDYNSGVGPRAYFCEFSESDVPVFAFNRPLPAETEFECPIRPRLTEWVSTANMTEEEKAAHPHHQATGGFLRVLDYKAAWAQAWEAASPGERAAVLMLPNFDVVVFERVTGVKAMPPEGEARYLVLDGVRYRLVPV